VALRLGLNGGAWNQKSVDWFCRFRSPGRPNLSCRLPWHAGYWRARDSQGDISSRPKIPSPVRSGRICSDRISNCIDVQHHAGRMEPCLQPGQRHLSITKPIRCMDLCSRSSSNVVSLGCRTRHLSRPRHSRNRDDYRGAECTCDGAALHILARAGSSLWARKATRERVAKL
jgi:hypothetical protein